MTISTQTRRVTGLAALALTTALAATTASAQTLPRPGLPTSSPQTLPQTLPTSTPAPTSGVITVDLGGSTIPDRGATTYDRASLGALTSSAQGSVKGNADGIAQALASLSGEQAPDLATDAETAGRDGRRHMRMHQTIDGLRVWGSDVKATSEGGDLVHLTARTFPSRNVELPLMTTQAAAIEAAVATHHGPSANADGYWHKAPTATPVMVVKNGVQQPGFEVVTWSADDNRLHHTLVDGNGRVVESELRTSEDRYRIYPDSPINSSQVVRSGPGGGNGSGPSPAGWLSSGTQYTRLIQGNNVAAYMDTDDDNQPDGGVVVEVGNTDFIASHSTGSQPTTGANRDFAVQNLFYLNNLIHDELYGHGFTEGARNFQVDNFGRGGAGGDSVMAEAQDGSGTNNANFATPGDGSSPRMQMYVWTATNPNRDSALDSDIVWHEYGHGLTWRMIGSMSGSVAGAIGEGMGDVLAILKNGDDRVGEYSANRSNGIRSARYGSYNRTIGDFRGTSVHFDGEIYAAALWRAGELYRAAGLSNDDLLDTAVDGMNFTPSRPTYIQMRDGLLSAAPGSEDCFVWRAFAQYGMGDGASFTVNSNGSASIRESFSVPSGCSNTPPPPPPPAPEPEPETGSATVSGLVGARGNQNRTYWAAQAQVQLSGANRGGVEVTGRWSNNTTRSCTTNSEGRCNITRYNIRRSQVSAVSFTIQTLDGSTATGSPLSVRINRP